MTGKRNLLNSKKLLVCAGALLGIALIIYGVVVASGFNQNKYDEDEDDGDADYTNSYPFENQQDRDLSYLAENYPISNLLPIQNYEKPTYYIGFLLDEDKDGNYSFKLEVGYDDESGKEAAMQRLSESDFASYGALDYEIVFRKRN